MRCFMTKLQKLIKHLLDLLMIILTLIITASCIFHLNQITGYTGTDMLNHFVYSSEWPTTTTKSIHNIWQWLVSVYQHTLL